MQRISNLLRCNAEWRPKGSPVKTSCDKMTLKKLEDAQTEAEKSNLI